ncbi:MAG: 30S ribosomal protein S1 [Flavobacteriales bacterium]|nr:30S ribosomal protein S1 [Flavobacteriales bacterium]NNK80494.1 30S ribosomal protein S1 [Flavobacteriales bacterium]
MNMAEENQDVNPEKEGQEVQSETVENSTETTETTSQEGSQEAEASVAAVETEVVEVAEVTEEAPKKATPPEDFDWDLFEHGQSTYDESEAAKLNQIYGDTLNSINELEVMEGTIVAMTKKEVVVNVGYKSEGVIALNEFRYNPDLAIGDKVLVYVESTEDKNGQLVLSHRLARLHGAWDRVNQAMEDGEIITGFVKCRTKGGLIADVFGIEAFLPGSQIDVKPIRDYDQYVGKNMEFKVVKINQEFKNVVVSHKALIEAEIEEQKKQIISGLEKGQVLEGTVKNITSYGVFVDLGGVDGLVHITDLSWGRINHPEEVVELDQKINVVILDFDDEKRRIALGIKQLSSHPWDGLDENLKVADKVKGKVVVIADYGAFIEIQPGIEGLLHVSEMSWSQHLRSAQDFLNVGDEVECEILTLDKEERKMSLGMKQLMDDPWKDIESKYPVDSKHTAKVRNFTHFGVFVELEEGVDGLVHISDLSWQKRIKHPSEFCNIGDEMDVIVLEVDSENRRLSLGHKQLEDNPWEAFEGTFAEGSTHDGTVIGIEGNSAKIALPYGMVAVCPKTHLKKEDGTTARIEEKLPFVVLEFNKNARKIMVSHLRTFEEDPRSKREKEEGQRREQGSRTSKAIENLKKNQEKSTLGDLDALAALKKKMEGGE